LGETKELTLFVDGDRGGNLIAQNVCDNAKVVYIAQAPDGKEVEEITKKEIHKALRSKVAVAQAKMEISNGKVNEVEPKKSYSKPTYTRREPYKRTERTPYKRTERTYSTVRKPSMSASQKTFFKKMLDDLMGTRGAYILDEGLNILGKVPTIELAGTIKSLKSVFAVVLDGVITSDIANMADKSGVKFLVAVDSKVKPEGIKSQIITSF